MKQTIHSPIFTGLTRPVLKFGVPFELFVFLVIFLPIIIIWTNRFIVPASCAAILYTICFFLTLIDDYFLSENIICRVRGRRSATASFLCYDSLSGE